jgi:hypothetical protein
VNKVRSERLNGKEFHDTIVETFLSEYDGTKSFEIPKEYSFPKKPRLMQRYVAYKIKTNPYFGNFSGIGAGKTLSAILSNRVIDSKTTIIICPNDKWQRHSKCSYLFSAYVKELQLVLLLKKKHMTSELRNKWINIE